MSRVKGALGARKHHKKVLKLAKGFYGARGKQYKIAKQSVMRAMAHAFAGRKQTKRDYRRLWIARINAAARLSGMSYSTFMHGLKLAGVNLNRKSLADLAVTDAPAFAKLVKVAQENGN
jgi:large subunit ribosomal protein L20